MSIVKLSNSSVNKWLDCGKMYEYHYVKKIRPTGNSSALAFGSALDSAIQADLEGGNAKDKFLEEWNKSKQDYSIVFFKSDLDTQLLGLDGLAELNEILPSHVEDIKEAVKLFNQAQFKQPSQELLRYMHLANWLSLKAKGLGMIEAFDRDLKPMFKEVLAVQKQIELSHPDGDSAVGFVDLVVKLHDDSIVIVDLKTASRPYAEDSVRTSAQLALYSTALMEEYPHQHCAYAVLIKKPKVEYNKQCIVCGTENKSSHKTCPEVINGKRCGGEFQMESNFIFETQFVMDEVLSNTKEKVIDNFNLVNIAIKNNIYPSNLSKCNDHYGARCPYYNLCYENSMDGLIQKELDVNT
jgi:hypothetical protein